MGVWMASATATVGVAATAYAGGPPGTTSPTSPTSPPSPPSGIYQFQSPGGNIACTMGSSGAACDIGDHTYTPPPKPADCHLGWGDRFSLQQGQPAMMDCHGDTLRIPGLPTLDYGQSQSSGPITCNNDAASGMTCTDTSSGHFFRVSSGSYQLG